MKSEGYTQDDYEREISSFNKRINILELTIQILILKSGLEKIAQGSDSASELAKKTLEKARQRGLLD